MLRPPTDFELVRAIYQRYRSTFLDFDDDAPTRSSRVYVPIDVAAIAEDLATDDELVFGRLYYALDARHRYTQEDGSRVALFHIRLGGDRHAVNFPLLESVYADLAQEQQRFLIPVGISVVALAISLFSFFG